MQSYRILKDILKGKVKFGEPLYKHTTFNIGGPALAWVEPQDKEDLKKLLEFANAYGIDTEVIGSGSNILASDKGYKGIVIHLSSPAFKKINFTKSKLTAGAGIKLAGLVYLSCKRSFGGFAGLAGIPGTVGGAVYMNSGYRESIGKLIHKINVMDKNGGSKIIYAKDIRFGYRKSSLTDHIILEAEFNLKAAPASSIIKSYNDNIRARKRFQPIGKKSAGCIFKNPRIKNCSASRLIDLCGLKGKKYGGASISDKHANFIINENSAKSSDVVHLIKTIQKKVEKKFNIKLELEIVRLQDQRCHI